MDVAFSPDGRRLAVAGRHQIKILDAATGEEVLVLRGYMQKHLSTNGYNPRVRFSPDGKRLLAVCHDTGWSLGEWAVEEQTAPADRLRAADRRAVIGHLNAAAVAAWDPQSLAFRHHYARLLDCALATAQEVVQRGRLHAAAGDWARAEADLAEAARRGRADADVLTACGQAYAEWAHWDEAAARLAEALALDPAHLDALCGAADVALRRGDRATFDRYRRELLGRYGNSDDPLICQLVVWRLLAAPGGAAEPGQVTRLVERAANRKPNTASFGNLLRGMAEYRAGRFEGALDRLAQASGGEADELAAMTQFFIAMAQYRLHRPAEARARLAEGGKIMDRWLPQVEAGKYGRHWSWPIHPRAVRAEAEALLGSATD